MKEMLRGDKCSCEPGTCAKGVEPTNDCIMRLDGNVEAVECKICGGQTWHHNGACIKCAREKARKSQVQQLMPVPLPIHTPAAEAPFDIIVQVARGKKFVVTNEDEVRGIMDILLHRRK